MYEYNKERMHSIFKYSLSVISINFTKKNKFPWNYFLNRNVLLGLLSYNRPNSRNSPNDRN